ncbi:MAG: BrnT family toxin [Gemmatimonadetes bacterium]|nr:BrnT family toxin [Gemmatimonadota bacterium]
MSLRFEYDPIKAARKLSKHGISFAEAETVFVDPLAREVPDLEHSFEEERLLLVGRSFRLRLLVVVFTERSDSIRIISAREATRAERSHYEEGS